MTGSESTGTTGKHCQSSQRTPEAWRWARDTRRAASSRRGHVSATCTASLERRPRFTVNSLRLVFLCGCSPGSHAPPGCSLLLLKHVRTSSLSLSPLCYHWCKLTAALGRRCVRAGAGLPALRGLQPELQGVGLSEAADSPPQSPSPASPSAPLLYPKIHSRPCKDGAGGKRGQ